MRKALITVILGIAILVSIPGFAQEKGKKAAMPAEKPAMMHEMMGMMQQAPPMMPMMKMWWNLGTMSHMLGQLLEETGEILGAGNLSSEAQKKLADLTKRTGQMASQMFAPMAPEKQQQYLEELGKIKEQLEALESAGKAITKTGK
jgi:hypothetical protein